MANRRPLDRSPYYVNHFEHLDRVLNRPQLTGIGISGCIGVGVLVTSGSLITTTGSLGAALSYVVAGGIAACVLYTLTEMVTSRPLTGSLIDLPHKFLDPAAGFATAALYSLANIISMAVLTAHSAELTALLQKTPLQETPQRNGPGLEVGINIAFIALTTVSHCLGVKLYGRLERVIAAFKLCLFVLVCIIMLVINVGGAGPRQTNYHANYTTYAFPSVWTPWGHANFSNYPIGSSGANATKFGLAGGGGCLFGFLTAITFAMFSCVGGEMIAMTAGEAKEPWKDVPVVMSFVYCVPLGLYPFVLISAAANVNYADPELPTAFGSTSGNNMTLSPFAVAVRWSAIHGLEKPLNLFFIISAYTAANTALYVASRSVFMLSQTYMPRKIADIFGRTNNGHTPLAAILFCSAFGFISLAGLNSHADTQPRQTMSAFYTGSVACVYICECFTFLKFKAGLKRLEKRKILSRNDPLYISRMFKSRWQPLPAYVGIVGCSFVLIWSGIPPLYLLGAKSRLSSADGLKSSAGLAFDVLGAWLGPLLFAVFYLTYKYITPHSRSVSVRDLTPSDYVLGDIDVIEGEDPTHRQPSRASPTLDRTNADSIHSVPPNDTLEPRTSRLSYAPRVIDINGRRDTLGSIGTFDGMGGAYDVGLPMDIWEEIEGDQAQKEERMKVTEILERRPRRMERRLARELWSCVYVDKPKAL